MVSADALDRDAMRAPSGAPPAVRFGLMPRAAHLTVLSGLEMNVYDQATLGEGAVEVRIYDRSNGLSAAIRKGDVDLACVPLRVAVQLFQSMGEDAPRIVAGAAIGDERYVVRSGIAAFETLPFAPLRVGVLENPTMDLAKALGIGTEDAPTARLVGESSAARKLASHEIDLAVLPEPLAAQVAALSSSRVEFGDDVPARRLVGGAVLIATREFITENAPLLSRLVSSHVLSAAFVSNDREFAIERATSILKAYGVDVVPALFWAQGISGIEFDPRIPRNRLDQLAGDAGDSSAGALIDDSFLIEAFAALEESVKASEDE